MNYPFWDVGIGYGILMAIVAIPHVFVSHFAIGGGLYLVVAETSARKAGDALRLEYLERLSKFFILLTLVFGALSGVGIWFIIGLLNPGATEALIRHFVWGWATEWTFFLVEIAAAIVYFYGWKRMPARAHIAVGWIYFGAAWLSLFVINGIIGFMLTPGEWLSTGSFWDGFFNPTYWPSLVFRTGICVLLAGVYAAAVASRSPAGDFKERVIRYNAVWALAGVALIVPSLYWYWKSIPPEIARDAAQLMTTPIASLRIALWALGILTVVLAVMGLAIPKGLRTGVAATLLALAFVFFGGFEWMRESIRKPYAIHGYMYGNAVEISKKDAYERDGYLAHLALRTGDDGADLFRHGCRSCHTIGGYKPLKPALDGTDAPFIAAVVKGTGVLRGNMPPFLGKAEEADSIAAHLAGRIDGRHLSEIYGLEGLALGRKVYEVRCGRCHVIGGHNDKTSSLTGLSEEDINGILDAGSDYGAEMPDFTGDDRERSSLVAFIQTMGKGGDAR